MIFCFRFLYFALFLLRYTLKFLRLKLKKFQRLVLITTGGCKRRKWDKIIQFIYTCDQIRLFRGKWQWRERNPIFWRIPAFPISQFPLKRRCRLIIHKGIEWTMKRIVSKAAIFESNSVYWVYRANITKQIRGRPSKLTKMTLRRKEDTGSFHWSPWR